MRITASHIINWANTNVKQAQTDLPRWIRRLCFDTAITQQLAFPAGDSSFVPGWDGILSCEQGNAWIPTGQSRWEIGCDQDVQSKAGTDYRKRTLETCADLRLACTFIFITPRRWIKKNAWVLEKMNRAEWADVRVYDAEDLEQWLEQSPSVTLQFGEALGLLGSGVESCYRYWNSWSQQCAPKITANALFMDRTRTQENLLVNIRQALSRSETSSILTIRADSVEEATAFVSATLISTDYLENQALVVSTHDGWRFVEANPQLKIAVAANAEVALHPINRTGLLVIIPHAIGNNSSDANSKELILERPNLYEFEKALIITGIEMSDAKRFAVSCGRSWTVLRRLRATNPSIQNPNWLNVAQSKSLITLCLLGTWDANKEADREIVARLAASTYEEIDADLRMLSGLDDAPLLSIGSIWKAKSPLELLCLFGDRITRTQLDRFFAIASEILGATDPRLDLEEPQRWMAQVYGKVHPFSELLFDSICDGLIKLAVRGTELQSLNALDIESRIASLVFDLLNGADDIRWLSLASQLPCLAEAAPEQFLTAVEKSLKLSGQPVTRLIKETSGAGMGNRCWHAGLLWALETLAWDARWLTRVTLILAQLTYFPLKGNWGNTPQSSLLSIFRPRFPQTSASVQSRIDVLELLIKRDENAAFETMTGLATPLGRLYSTFAARPKWREDDAGAGSGVTNGEVQVMQDTIKEALFRLSENNVARIATLLHESLIVPSLEMPRVLVLIAPFLSPTVKDSEKEVLQTALRKVIHWHRNYDDTPVDKLDAWLLAVEHCYTSLAPTSLVSRYRWLFNSHWVELPGQGNHDALPQIRESAVLELFTAEGIEGVENLVRICQSPRTIGMTLFKLEWSSSDWSNWIVAKGDSFVPEAAITWCIEGLLNTILPPKSKDILQTVLSLGDQQKWTSEKKARFLILARFERETWQVAAENSPETEQAYWQYVCPLYTCPKEESSFVIAKLLAVHRPRSALKFCRDLRTPTPPGLLISALQDFLAGHESEGALIDSWHLGKMIDELEQCDEIERATLIQLEFGLFSALRDGEMQKAKTLYLTLMSEPTHFAELISLAYSPEQQERAEPITETERTLGMIAREILDNCRRMPGTAADGLIAAHDFMNFIDTARNLCAQADRLAVCDSKLGEILAHAPIDEDGTWPFLPAREVLDRTEPDDMRQGFIIGTYYNRGVTSRSILDGGEQERDLATYYFDLAKRVQHSHPKVATALESIGTHYERNGKREDIKANLRKEGF